MKDPNTNLKVFTGFLALTNLERFQNTLEVCFFFGGGGGLAKNG